MAGEKRLAVIILHGIGTYSRGNFDREDFDKSLKKAMQRRLGDRFDQVAWQSVVWSDPALERRQSELIKLRTTPGFWPWDKAFDFVSSFLSDASAYTLPLDRGAEDRPEPLPADRTLDEEERMPAYYRVQELVRQELRTLEDRLGPAAASIPVLAIAHSMGCHVLSCYRWDAERAPHRIPGGPLSPFESLRNLSSLVYVGCNLPLLTMNVPKRHLLPIRLPKKPEALGGLDSAWLNYWEKNDLLGYKIAGEYSSYFGGDHPRRREFPEWGRDPAQDRAPQDWEVKGGLITGQLPTVHGAYYDIGTVQKGIAAEIVRLLDRP